MKPILLTIIVSILLVGTLYAGISLNKTDSTIDISKARVDAIKTTGVNSIDVKADAIKCDDKYCWANVYQEGLIQTEFKTIKYYCSNQKLVFNNKTNRNQTICIQYTDYTPEQLITKRDSFIKQRLESYANNIINKSSKDIPVQIDDRGTITSK